MSEERRDSELEQPDSIGQTLLQGMKQETEELVQFELDVEDLAEREASLLNAYLADDAESVKNYWQELKQEVLLQAEFRAESWLASVASPAVVDWLRLDFCMQRDASQLLAGEIAAEQELCCVDCGQRFGVQASTPLAPCRKCGSEIFAARPLQIQ